MVTQSGDRTVTARRGGPCEVESHREGGTDEAAMTSPPWRRISAREETWLARAGTEREGDVERVVSSRVGFRLAQVVAASALAGARPALGSDRGARAVDGPRSDSSGCARGRPTAPGRVFGHGHDVVEAWLGVQEVQDLGRHMAAIKAHAGSVPAENATSSTASKRQSVPIAPRFADALPGWRIAAHRYRLRC
jgi:hypothetical protein